MLTPFNMRLINKCCIFRTFFVDFTTEKIQIQEMRVKFRLYTIRVTFADSKISKVRTPKMRNKKNAELVQYYAELVQY